MMLYLVEYDKGYHTDQLEPMGTIFARAVAFAQSLKFDRILQDVLQKSKSPTSTIIDSRIGHQNDGGPSQEDGGQIARRHLPPMTNDKHAEDVATEADKSENEGSVY
jgi:hypothetical protein